MKRAYFLTTLNDAHRSACLHAGSACNFVGELDVRVGNILLLQLALAVGMPQSPPLIRETKYICEQKKSVRHRCVDMQQIYL